MSSGKGQAPDRQEEKETSKDAEDTGSLAADGPGHSRVPKLKSMAVPAIALGLLGFLCYLAYTRIQG